MALVGTYNPSTFVEGNYATYPQLPPGATYYQPTMHWEAVGAPGIVQGQTVLVGDLLFATQGGGRRYGDGTYGSQIYGGLSDGDWTVQQVMFLRWQANLPPPDTVPYPNAGCPFTRHDTPGGNWAPGWRIVIDAFYDPQVDSRRYGDLTYGAGVYGSTTGGGTRWVDITRPTFAIETGDGNQDGSPRVVVAEVDITLVDTTGQWLDVATPATWRQPQPGTPLRVGFIDPTFTYWPVITAEVERIEDAHDGEHPRVVAMRAFGRIMDLTVDVPQVQRPAENASQRFAALTTMAGWRWDNGAVTFPPGDAQLHADTGPKDITVRDELDRTVQSVGWFLDSDRRGRMRVRTWPVEPAGAPLVVVDCAADDTTDELVSHSIVYANDQAQLLNYVATTNQADTVLQVTQQNDLSVGRFGRRGRAFGFPMSALAWAAVTTAQAWAIRVVNRFGFITRRVESVEVDTLLAPAWLPALAAMDTGQALRIERREVEPVTFNGAVTGWRHTIEPGRWRSVLFTTTTDTSM